MGWRMWAVDKSGQITEMHPSPGRFGIDHDPYAWLWGAWYRAKDAYVIREHGFRVNIDRLIMSRALMAALRDIQGPCFSRRGFNHDLSRFRGIRVYVSDDISDYRADA